MHRRSRSHSTHDSQRAVPALRELVRREHIGYPKRRDRVHLLGLHDAEDDVLGSVQANCPADDRGVGGEARPPERIAEDHTWRCVRTTVVLEQDTAEQWPNSEERKEI